MLQRKAAKFTYTKQVVESTNPDHIFYVQAPCYILMYLNALNHNDVVFVIKKCVPIKGTNEELLMKNNSKDFPGGAVDKNPPANAEDTRSIPGLVISHMPQGT